MISLRDFDFPEGESLREEKRALLEKLRDCDDIVHGWDDPGDFSLWVPVFAVLTPPSEEDAS